MEPINSRIECICVGRDWLEIYGAKFQCAIEAISLSRPAISPINYPISVWCTRRNEIREHEGAYTSTASISDVPIFISITQFSW